MAPEPPPVLRRSSGTSGGRGMRGRAWMVLLPLLWLCGGCLTLRDPGPSRSDPPIGEPGAELDARPDIQADQERQQEQDDPLLPSSP